VNRLRQSLQFELRRRPVRRTTSVFAIVFLAASALAARAQDASADSNITVPAATRSQAACTGFIADPSVPRDLVVLGGGDDDFHSVVRQFTEGDSIFISHHSDATIAVGARYRVVRSAAYLFTTTRYSGEKLAVSGLGKPYEDVAEVTVTHVNPEGVVAKVNFSCEAVQPGDTLIPFEARVIPDYTLTPPLDHFAPADPNKKHGRITASKNNFGYLGAENIVYLNLGEGDGAKPGQRYRIFRTVPPHSTGFLTWEKTPTETVGEVVVLSVQKKSSAAIIVTSYREISSGDAVEAE
jgi:hypothetical protein